MEKVRQQRVSLWRIFLVFAKIGAFTIGGGYAMVMLIRDEVVGRGWISSEEFPDLLALAQTAPGLLAVNMSIFAGYRIRGTKGGVVATLGSILPPFLIILIIAMVFAQFQNNPYVIRVFKGIRPVVVALIAVPMVKMARESNKRWWTWVISAAALALVAFLHISPIYILLTTIVIALSVAVGRDKTTRMRNMRARVEERRAKEAEKTSAVENETGEMKTEQPMIEGPMNGPETGEPVNGYSETGKSSVGKTETGEMKVERPVIEEPTDGNSETVETEAREKKGEEAI